MISFSNSSIFGTDITFFVSVFCSTFLASNSISRFLIFFSKISNSTGFEIVFNFTLDRASSIKSIALSGNFLSVIYFILKSTAETIAPSVIFIP